MNIFSIKMMRKNEYDSNFFKRDIYSLTLLSNGGKSTKKIHFPSLLPAGLIIGRIPAENIKTLQKAIKAGFEILCPMADLELDLLNQSLTGHDNNIRAAEYHDYKKILNIAERAFSFSRFHREQTISADANEYHKKWAENCLNGSQADVVLVCVDADNVNGFIAAAYDKNKREAKIVLIGVLPEKQSMGVGKRLLNAGIKWAKDRGAARLYVRTEADNDTALALYLKNGFRLKELSFYLRKDNISKQ